jgi:hypothetical protein
MDANFDNALSALSLGILLALGSLGCQRAADAPVRSPSQDYPLPPPQTSDGQVVGVDNRPPEDRLAEGASSDGLAPGWSADQEGLEFDPKRPPRGTTPEHQHDADAHPAPAPVKAPASK